MRVIIKPAGLVALTLAMGTLSLLAFVNLNGKSGGVAATTLPPQLTVRRALAGPRPVTSGYTLVEAEASPRGEVRSDPTASGGKYVRVTKPYEPMVWADVPAGEEAFTVWARVRGVACQLKASPADPAAKQVELDWSWKKPAAFEWVRLGRHRAAELGSRVLVIRGPNKSAAEGEGIDAVVLAEDDAFEPNRLLRP